MYFIFTTLANILSDCATLDTENLENIKSLIQGAYGKKRCVVRIILDTFINFGS